MICQWQSGLLVMRECGQPAMAGCSMCGRSICMAHSVPGPNGMACPQCASSAEGYEDTEDTEIAETRGQYAQQFGTGAGYFTPADSSSLGRGGAATPTQRPYDPRES